MAKKLKWPEKQGKYLYVGVYDVELWLFKDKKSFRKAQKYLGSETDIDNLSGIAQWLVNPKTKKGYFHPRGI